MLKHRRVRRADALIGGLDKLMHSFNTVAGGGSLSLASKYSKPDVWPTGFPEIDNKVMVIGGIPRGRVIEIAGKPSAGKSTLAINIMANAVEQGKRCVYCDKEGTMTWEYGETIGAPRRSYLIYRGECMSGPQFLDKVLLAIEAGAEVVILDSLSFVASEEMSDVELDSISMHAEQSTPKMTKAFAQKLYSGWTARTGKRKGSKISITDTDCTLIIINHLKDAIGPTYGKPASDSRGGETLKFAYSMRIFLERYGYVKEESTLDEEGMPTYSKVSIMCEKNKLAPPGHKTTMWLNHATGRFVSDPTTFIDAAIKAGVLSKGKKGFYVLSDTFLSKGNNYKRISKGYDVDATIHGLPGILNLMHSNKKLVRYVMAWRP